ncbi:hypothetical protein LOAG_09722 [Loa loa]|uniref:Uncharacterized protein n=1 Tax=Loa loa TaxID=7209 RepID=A0A1S0TRC5_LOALO|nr:hypothetical protein LOAG_09722 [Loa loa]EFO18772.1 hypothetical protein LOAG_09722 [Loa loa]
MAVINEIFFEFQSITDDMKNAAKLIESSNVMNLANFHYISEKVKIATSVMLAIRQRETSSVIFDHISESPRSQTIRVPEEQGHKTIPESSVIFHIPVVERLTGTISRVIQELVPKIKPYTVIRNANRMQLCPNEFRNLKG